MKNVTKLSLDLSALEDDASALNNDFEHQTTYQLPEEQGSLKGVFLKTSHDMVLYRGDYTFNQEAIGPEYVFGKTDIAFAEDTFMANILIGGMMRSEDLAHHNQQDENEQKYTFGGEMSYFRHLREFEQEIYFETSKKVVNSALTIPISSMKLLIGEENTDNLLSFLDISALSDVSVQKIPMRITQILHAAVNPHLTGSMKQLYCQAKALEYLCELVELMEKREMNSLYFDIGEPLITDIHDNLIDHVGRLPTMAELAEQYGVPARTLNAKFQKQYGLTINQYITRVRLNKAHEIVRNSDVVLKVIAAKLGYSHVNHFITAFKREFGYPPGSLRK